MQTRTRARAWRDAAAEQSARLREGHMGQAAEAQSLQRAPKRRGAPLLRGWAGLRLTDGDDAPAA
eukprot:4418191-Alexandrium_andersonii.AAC.1